MDHIHQLQKIIRDQEETIAMQTKAARIQSLITQELDRSVQGLRSTNKILQQRADTYLKAYEECREAQRQSGQDQQQSGQDQKENPPPSEENPSMEACRERLCQEGIHSSSTFKKFAMKHHPDRNPNATEQQKQYYSDTVGCYDAVSKSKLASLDANSQATWECPNPRSAGVSDVHDPRDAWISSFK